MNPARDRIDNDFSPTFPDKDLICKDCKYRRIGHAGARNSYCSKYPNGKPDNILFKKAKCQLYEEEDRWTPITGTFPDENTILCKDCMFRDKTILEIGGKIYTRITNDTCEKYTGYGTINGTGYKPHEILFNQGNCIYYKKDNS